MNTLTTLFAIVLLVHTATAKVQTLDIVYTDGETKMRGYAAFDPEQLPKAEDGESPGAPAVLIVHQWMGLTDYEKGRAKHLAELGYVVFALDIYGSDHSPTNMQEAGQASGRFKNDRELFRKRLNLGLTELKRLPFVDPDRVAAIGYCFGGTGVLELARSGADVAGVVSFHGGLDAPKDGADKNIKGKVLVLHGADDPFVPREGIDAMKKSFNDAKVDWQMIEYSGAVHSFTQPMAGNDNARGAAYNEKADKRSWQHMRSFFDEVIGKVD